MKAINCLPRMIVLTLLLISATAGVSAVTLDTTYVQTKTWTQYKGILIYRVETFDMSFEDISLRYLVQGFTMYPKDGGGYDIVSFEDTNYNIKTTPCWHEWVRDSGDGI